MYDHDSVISTKTKRVLWILAGIAIVMAVSFTWVASENPGRA